MLKPLKETSTYNKQPVSSKDRKLRNANFIENFSFEELNAFGAIYSRFSKPIFKYVKKQVKSIHVAEELTQDIFCKIYQFRNSYNSDYDLSTWIWTITRNTIYDHLRQYISSHGLSHIVDFPLEGNREPVSTETAESIMIEEFEKRKLLEMMALLSTKQKEAIFLRLVRKFSYREISTAMNLSLSAVKSLINRGKNTLIKAQSVF